MRYMIHAVPERMWYVDDYLVPSMTEQGIPREAIKVWCDIERIGNLYSCVSSFQEAGEEDGGTWHLQDDVIISRDFAEATKEAKGVVCGFCCKNFGGSLLREGKVKPSKMWYSFQCIHIPNKLAGEFARWFYEEAEKKAKYYIYVSEKKHDDWFWREFLIDKHPDMTVYNRLPCIVDHIDYLIGGTLINHQRRLQVNTAINFPDSDLIDDLGKRLNHT